MLARGGGDFDAAQHARDFLNALSAGKQLNPAEYAARVVLSADTELLVRARRNLRKVRHTEHLAVGAKLSHEVSNHLGDRAADPRVGLVENQRRHRITLCGQHRNGQADSREFAA